MDEKLAAVDENLRGAEAHRYVSEIEVGWQNSKLTCTCHDMCILFRFILDKMVRAVTDGRAGSKMPGKVESYVAYLDLCYIVGANASDSHRSGDDVEGGEGAAGEEKEEAPESEEDQGHNLTESYQTLKCCAVT